ncbi:MAG: peptide chain release factor N(5)-glutamine methyltransferase [Oscillospiraceae bacterium]|nr:peptide chain release factor N(5)-glutamine methyltransferase [Oscillospiraceae bacterium]
MNSFEACREIKKILDQGIVPTENDINVIYETATGHKRYDYAHMVSDAEFEKIKELAERRASGEPLQYISGRWPFLDFEVRVDRRALIPRPETEILAETCIDLMYGRDHPVITDLCSGSGVLAISLKRAFPSALVTAVELSQDAAGLLRENSDELCGDIAIVNADVFLYQSEMPDGSQDLIVCNPPYITERDYANNYAELKEEPRMAFLGGDDGLSFYRHIIPAYRDKLSAGGIMAFEIGNEQADSIVSLFEQNGFSGVAVKKDYSSLDRIAYARVN